MSMMIFKGYVYDVETKNINGSQMFEATVKNRMGYGDNAITVFTRVAFWGQLAQIASEKIQKDCKVHITSEIKGGRLYMTKKGEPGFGMNCKGLGFEILAAPGESQPSSWGNQRAETNQGGGWGGGGYESNQGGGGWGGGSNTRSNSNPEEIPF